MSDRALYGKNVSLDFGRCPVRSIFPLVLDMLARHQDVFGEVGTKISLVDKIVGLDEAKAHYELFDKRNLSISNFTNLPIMLFAESC
jgi:hypothetical protein